MKAIALLLLASVQAIRIDPVPINTRLMQIGFVDESEEIVKEAQTDAFLPPCDNVKKKTLLMVVIALILHFTDKNPKLV